MRRILIATEGSSCTTAAVRQFVELFQPSQCEVYLLSVIALADKPEDHPAAVAHYQRDSEAAAEALELTSADLAIAGYSAFELVRVGAPAATIVEVATEIHADLVVLGTHGRHGLDKLLKGSVAEDVLHHAPCAVFIHPYHPQAVPDLEDVASSF